MEKQDFKCWKCLRVFENTDELNIDYDRQDKEDNWICNECKHNNFKAKYELITDRHDKEENALIVEGYPYGFKRTKIRYWIETTKNGDRFVSQTLNPKTDKWNNPHKSTYNAVEVLIKEKATGYTRSHGLHASTSRTAILNFLDFIKDYALSKAQEEQIRILKALSKTYENVHFEISPRGNDEVKNMLADKEQAEIKKDINKMVGYFYKTGEF